MTILTVTLPPAAADHYGEKGWTLVRRPTEPCPGESCTTTGDHHLGCAAWRAWGKLAKRDRAELGPAARALMDGPRPGRNLVPARATVPCGADRCRHGYIMSGVPEDVPKCGTCGGSGVVARTVEVERAANPDDAEVEDEGYPAAFAATLLGRAEVAEVPVIPLGENHLKRESLPFLEVHPTGLVVFWWWDDSDGFMDNVTLLFPTAPEPGSTAWLVKAGLM